MADCKQISRLIDEGASGDTRWRYWSEMGEFAHAYWRSRTRSLPPRRTPRLPSSSSGPSAPRALLHAPWEASVRRGADTVLPCLVHADPPPVVT
ncbi:unnamed protein product [Plutella xylostella]|uniref:(diamondback moth) hypothetical protein n=1 Tax=Plutella xylostella TaxID=51655 RepID=A0A8S4G9B7_PLUXY|nr:unnamed protein product [Plutella xylostella]